MELRLEEDGLACIERVVMTDKYKLYSKDIKTIQSTEEIQLKRV